MPKGLTSEFGMGSGVTPPPCHHDNSTRFYFFIQNFYKQDRGETCASLHTITAGGDTTPSPEGARGNCFSCATKTRKGLRPCHNSFIEEQVSQTRLLIFLVVKSLTN